jgi:hypothetical protein
MRKVALLSALLVAGSGMAGAAPKPAPLTPLPGDKLATLVPSLSSMDLALIESNSQGQLKQMTTISLVAASPAAVHEVVAHPERYGQFIHNMSRSDVKQEPGGTLFHDYKLDYTVASVDGHHRYVFLPPVEGQAAAPIQVYDCDDNGVRHYRWEFYDAPEGRTLLVLYGYTQIPSDGIYGKLIHRAQTLEYGLALIPQMTLMLAMKQRAEQQAGPQPPMKLGPQPNMGFLLERGTVALFRRGPDKRLAEVNLVDRTRARPEVLLQVASNSSQWSRFVPTMERSTPVGQRQGLPAVELVQSLPLMSWTTTFGVMPSGNGIDMFGLDGDLARARMRWDVRAVKDGSGAPLTEIVLRCVESFDKGSYVVRGLYKLEPLFEYGIDVGLQLVILQGVKWQAERLTPSQAAR